MKWEVKNVDGKRGYGAHDWYQVQLMSDGFVMMRGKTFRFGDRDAAFIERDRLNAELAAMVNPRFGFDVNGKKTLISDAPAA